ncbi:MAG: peptide deformylase [Kofleriaceae bacterium]
MAVREIVQVGDPVLRRRADEVIPKQLSTPELVELIADMRDTMRAAPGVGLAAPQIGVSLQIAVIEDTVEGLSAEQRTAREREPVGFHVLVNPTLTVLDSERVAHFEGCLSFAPFQMIVQRARKVRVEALDEHGQRITRDASGWYARILQHEIDHLRGIVCCDRMDSRTLTTTTNFTRHYAGKSVADVKSIIGKPPRE